MLNATVGLRRLFKRLQPDPERRLSARAGSARRRTIALAAAAHHRVARLRTAFPGGPIHRAQGAHRTHTLDAHVGRSGRSSGRSWRSLPASLRYRLQGIVLRERFLAVSVASLVLVASVLSAGAGATTASGGTGGTLVGDPNRIAIGGGTDGIDPGAIGGTDGTEQVGANLGMVDQPDPSTDPTGPFLDDGTLLMPVAVDTTVEDGSSLLIPYRVKSGDTLTGIAHHFGVSMMSIWWANQLASKDQLHVGQVLVIPPADGLLVTVKSGDTLDSIAAKTGVTGDEILAYNAITDPNLIVGQKIFIPGAVGKAIPTPKPTPVPHYSSGGGGGGSIHPPSGTYGGGTFAWPVPGGGISQYFHYGHPALDIAAPYGSRIVAAAAGTVIYAGWKDDMGGYQVWISHGSGLYTAYYHMSAVTVSVGEHVGRASQIGRIGTSGVATGPHCHFEVWRGYPWLDSSYRVNPLGYL